MALTDDFSYMLGDGGIILNPNSTIMPFVDITSVKGLDNAPYRTTERDHEGTDGGFMDAEYEKGRSIVLEGTLYAVADQVEPYLDNLKANFAPSRTLIPFYFKKPGVAERFLKVKPLGVRYDIDQIRRLGYTDVQFSMFAEDPRVYSSNLRDFTIQQTAVSIGGRSYNKSYSYSYGASITPSGGNFPVGGNRPTPPIITISGPAEYPIIVNDTLGATMLFDIILDSGSSLTIDMYYHTVKINGVENRRSSLVSPEWFFFQPGNNFLRYRSRIDGNSTLNARYYDAWR